MYCGIYLGRVYRLRFSTQKPRSWFPDFRLLCSRDQNSNWNDTLPQKATQKQKAKPVASTNCRYRRMQPSKRLQSYRGKHGKSWQSKELGAGNQKLEARSRSRSRGSATRNNLAPVTHPGQAYTTHTHTHRATPRRMAGRSRSRKKNLKKSSPHWLCQK